MNEHVFRRVLGASRACKRTGSSDYALAYSSPTDAASGHEWSDGTLVCGASNWVLSAKDLHALMSALGHGGRLLSEAARTTMSCQRLGFDNEVRPADCPEGNLCKHGAVGYFPVPDAPYQAVRTYAGLFACNTPVVLIANSPLPSQPDDALTFVRDALKSATLDHAPKGARHCAKAQFDLAHEMRDARARPDRDTRRRGGGRGARAQAGRDARDGYGPAGRRVGQMDRDAALRAARSRQSAGFLEFSASPAAPDGHATWRG